MRAAAIDIPSAPLSIARRLLRAPDMVVSFRLFATPALAKRRGRFHLPLFQLTAWTPPPDASRCCMSLNAIGGGAGMRQIQPVIHGNARRAGLHLSDHRGAGESLVAKQCQHRGDRLRRTGDQQSAARLRIAQERLLPRREIVRQTYVMAATCPVAR